MRYQIVDGRGNVCETERWAVDENTAIRDFASYRYNLADDHVVIVRSGARWYVTVNHIPRAGPFRVLPIPPLTGPDLDAGDAASIAGE